jgi:DNA-directed RNA polymerase specialized sigma24 family protein
VNPKLKQLQAHWYRKLKDDGFEDIEDPDTGFLKTWTGYREFRVDKAAYYRLAQLTLASRRMARFSRTRRAIWRLHAKGLSYTEIVQELGVSDQQVQRAVKAVRQEFSEYFQ